MVDQATVRIAPRDDAEAVPYVFPGLDPRDATVDESVPVRELCRAGKHGGLSGVFLPVSAQPTDFGPGTTVSLFGQPSKEDFDNRWSQPREPGLADWQSRGFITAIEPKQASSGQIFGFTIHRLPREASPWEPASRLTQIDPRLSGRDQTVGVNSRRT